jgi:hypothetical protein
MSCVNRRANQRSDSSMDRAGKVKGEGRKARKVVVNRVTRRRGGSASCTERDLAPEMRNPESVCERSAGYDSVNATVCPGFGRQVAGAGTGGGHCQGLRASEQRAATGVRGCV